MTEARRFTDLTAGDLEAYDDDALRLFVRLQTAMILPYSAAGDGFDRAARACRPLLDVLDRRAPDLAQNLRRAGGEIRAWRARTGR
ncbi:hypothetical protein [Pacificispira sp.]|uniref:hypothetical protein n=1 Tax=Pacificispira sp. TaxID=2888761 RepID=UPI003BAB1FE2